MIWFLGESYIFKYVHFSLFSSDFEDFGQMGFRDSVQTNSRSKYGESVPDLDF